MFHTHVFLDKCDGDKDLRDNINVYKAAGIIEGHTWYDFCAKFCFEYDQPSFDPEYDTDALETFVPLVTEVFARKPYW